MKNEIKKKHPNDSDETSEEARGSHTERKSDELDLTMSFFVLCI